MEHRTQIYLGETHYRFLHEKAEREGVSLAQVIRSLIEKEMPSHKLWEKDPIFELKNIKFHSGIKNGSRQHHQILRDSLKQHRKQK